jgi:hypothetical protein
MSRLYLLSAALISAALIGGAARAQFGSTASYVAGATSVVKGSDGTFVDRGIVVCRSDGKPSVGGACIPFSPLGDSIKVIDDKFGTSVAFQVCIDQNGDGRCGGGHSGIGCSDDVFFSHDDAGSFFNPLGPLPTGFRLGCGGGFPGYVVFICQGTHFVPTVHHHPATKGTIALTTGGIGGPDFGNFCQSDEPTKSYVLK